MKKVLTGILVLLFTGCMLVGCGGNKAADGQVELKLGHIQSESDLWQKGAEKFKEEVEKKSNGKMKVTIYPNSTLGGDRDLAEGMQMGTVDFALIAGVLGNFDKSISLLELPYLFDNHEQYDAVVNGEIGKKISENVLKSSGIRILNWWDRGPRQVTSNKPINTLDDIQGLKIRVPEIPAMVETWRAMGASPTPMAWSEVYTSLQQNVIDAQENPVPFIYGGRIQEVQKYLALTEHKYEYVTLAMSDKKWQQLTPEQQKIIQDAAQVATEYENKLVVEQTGRMLKEMEDGGLQVTKPDKAAFAAKAKAAHEAYAKTVDLELYHEILQAIGR
ncbi:TRAP transporter substrate-binding protein [Selenomonas sputigena]|uniref:TRAP transporter substrate-binding protein n=1 Tax=Selenomonas sputigena TaxID=69823 RepID=A0ABV3X3V2_9FIRM